MNFVERTDKLAETLGCRLEDLPEVIGFSRGSLFAYRSGRQELSPKAERKLQGAEIKAGLRQRDPDATVPGMVEQVSIPYSTSVEARLSRMEQMLIALQAQVNDLRSEKEGRS